MRKPIHTAVVKFRVSDALIASAAEIARREGMSVPELMRQALRREVKAAA